MGIRLYVLVDVEAATASVGLSVGTVLDLATGVAAAWGVSGPTTIGVLPGVLAASISAARVAIAASVAIWTPNVAVVEADIGVLVDVAVRVGAFGVGVGTKANSAVGVTTTAVGDTGTGL